MQSAPPSQDPGTAEPTVTAPPGASRGRPCRMKAGRGLPVTPHDAPAAVSGDGATAGRISPCHLPSGGTVASTAVWSTAGPSRGPGAAAWRGRAASPRYGRGQARPCAWMRQGRATVRDQPRGATRPCRRPQSPRFPHLPGTSPGSSIPDGCAPALARKTEGPSRRGAAASGGERSPAMTASMAFIRQEEMLASQVRSSHQRPPCIGSGGLARNPCRIPGKTA